MTCSAMKEFPMIEEVVRIDEKLCALSWPAIKTTLNNYPGEGDIVVLCGGFEERAQAYLQHLGKSRATDYCVKIFDYLPYYPQNRTASLQTLALKKVVDVKTLIYDRSKPSGVADSFLSTLNCEANVFLDISAMSRLLIIQLITGLIRDLNVRRLNIVYAESETYPPTQEEADKRLSESNNVTLDGGFLSKGVLEVAAAPELSSIAMPSEAVRLVVFPSLDPVQLSSVVDELQPSYIHLLHGMPPRSELAWRHDIIRTMNLQTCSESKHDSEVSVSTLDYRETIDALLEIYQQHSIFDRIVVSPMGSKMQSLGVGLVRAVLPDIQIVYPTPHQFTTPDRYTMGLRNLYSLEVPLEELRSLLVV